MSDLQKKLHAYSRRADHIMKGFEQASKKVGVNPSALETELLQTKKIAIEETKNMEQMFSEAIAAMKKYQGYSEEEGDEDDWE